jgi:hypothetical protein
MNFTPCILEQVVQPQIQSGPKPQNSSSSQIAKIAALSLFALALALSVVRAVGNATSQFVGPHAFVSADVATTARTFAREGIWKLHGIPVNNNTPIGPRDRYTHWPPLLPVLLSVCFRLFGASEYVSHVFMLGVLVATALLVFRLGTIWLGMVGGALAGYFWLTLPVVVQFGDLVVQQSLAMLFVVAALVAFYSGRDKLGAGLLFFAVLSAWEAVLVLPGIWLASRWLPELRRTVAMATIGIGTGLACVVGLFVLGSPALTADTLQTVKYYMGLSPTYSHMLPHDRVELDVVQQISGILWNHLWMLGALASAAILQLLAARRRDGVLLASALAGPWILWTILMRTHVAIHHFELLIAAPLAALALAWLATEELRVGWSRNAMLKTGAFVALAALQLAVLPRPKIGIDRSPESLIRYARDIRNSTPPGSIVMAPLLSPLPLYYSERHIVRGIVNGDALSRELPDIRSEFPRSPVYLAVPPFLADSFASVLSHGTIVSSTKDVIIARLETNETLR